MSYDIKDILKKFWFVIVVGIIFISIAIFFAWDTNKDTIGAKTHKDKDVIFSLADQNYTADEYYKALFDKVPQDSEATNGVLLVYRLLERDVVDQSVKATEAMEKEADKSFESAEAYYKNLYGDKYETSMSTQLRQLGYSGVGEFKDFFLDQAKSKKLINDYIEKHPELFDEVYEKEAPRVISHILVKTEDAENPTDEEKAKMKEVDDALKKDSFSDVAKKYSDDEGSAKTGGSLGVQLKSSSLVDEFKDAAWALKDGEVSTWVKSQYGYHLIKIDTTDKEKMLTTKEFQDSLSTAVLEYKPNLSKQIIWEKAKKLKVEIKDKELEKQLLKHIGVEK